MCLAIPGKILKIINPQNSLQYSIVDFDGITKDICTAWVDAQVGDYVLAHAGMAITIIDKKEAVKTLKALKAIGDI